MKRGQGEGSLRELPGGRWRAQVMLAGERRSATFGTRAEALEWVAALKSRRRAGGLPSREAERETVATYLLRWLEGRRVAVGEGTWRVLESNVSLHLLPRLGAVRLALLSADDVRAALGALLRPPGGTGTLAPATVQKVRAALRQAVQQAVDDGLLAQNVVTPPGPRGSRSGRSARSCPRPTWCASGRRRGATPWRPCGAWRPSSPRARGAAGPDVGRPHRAGGRHRPAGHPAQQDGAGVRAVELDAGLVGLLREHRRRQLEARLAAGERWAGHPGGGLVFCTAHGRPWPGATSCARSDGSWRAPASPPAPGSTTCATPPCRPS